MQPRIRVKFCWVVGLLLGLCPVLWWVAYDGGIGPLRMPFASTQSQAGGGWGSLDPNQLEQLEKANSVTPAITDAEADELENKLLAGFIDKREIPNGPGCLTEVAITAERLEFSLRRLADYRRLTRDAQAVQPSVIEFMTAIERSQHDQPTKSLDELRQVGLALQERGVRDPLFLTALAKLYRRDSRLEKEVQLLLEAEEEFKKQSYPPIWRIPGLARLIQLKRYFDPMRLNDVELACREQTVALLREALPAELRCLVWRTVSPAQEGGSNNFLESLVRDCRRLPAIDPWMKAMLEARYEYRVAWKHRSGGYVDSISPAQWQKFEEHLTLARAHYLTALKIDPQQPQPATEMIVVAGDGGIGQLSPRQWFDVAVSVQMDYEPAYKSLTKTLLPRWGGSYDEMVDFAKECLETNRFDTDVPYQAYLTLNSLRSDQAHIVSEYWATRPAGEPPPQFGETWENERYYAIAKAAFEGMEREPSRDHRAFRSHLQTMHHHFQLAILANELQDARRLYSALGPRFDLRQFPATFDGRAKFQIARMLAHTGDLADEVKQTGRLLKRREFRQPDSELEALPLYEALAKKNTDPQAAPYFEALLTRLRQEIAFAGGQWVDLLFDSDLLSWRCESGRWTVESENSVVGECKVTELGLRLSSASYFPGPIEVELDVEEITVQEINPGTGLWPVTLPSGVPGLWAGPGPGIGLAPGIKSALQSHIGGVLWVDGLSQAVGLFQPPNLTRSNRLSLQPRNHLHARLWEHTAEFYVNGQFVHPLSDNDWLHDGTIGLVTAIHRGGQLRLSNFRIRKLTYGPPPKFTDAKYSQSVEYYTRALQDNPQYAALYRLRGMSFFFLKEYAKALPDFRKLVELDPQGRGTLLWVGETLRYLGQYQEAIDTLRKAIAKEPQEPLAYAVLCLIYAACPDADLRDPQQALQIGTKARELDQKSAPVTLSLATAHAAAGQFADAVRLARESLGQADDDYRSEADSRLKLFESRMPYLLAPATGK